MDVALPSCPCVEMWLVNVTASVDWTVKIYFL